MLASRLLFDTKMVKMMQPTVNQSGMTHRTVFLNETHRCRVTVILHVRERLNACLTQACRSFPFPHPLAALHRRAPRTKSIHDRTSSRCYSVVDFDFPEHQLDRPTNPADLNDSRRQPNTDVISSSNEHDDSTVSIEDDDADVGDSDEYACFIFTLLLFLLFLRQPPCTMSAVSCFAWVLRLLRLLIDFDLLGEKHE